MESFRRVCPEASTAKGNVRVCRVFFSPLPPPPPRGVRFSNSSHIVALGSVGPSRGYWGQEFPDFPRMPLHLTGLALKEQAEPQIDISPIPTSQSSCNYTCSSDLRGFRTSEMNFDITLRLNKPDLEGVAHIGGVWGAAPSAGSRVLSVAGQKLDQARPNMGARCSDLEPAPKSAAKLVLQVPARSDRLRDRIRGWAPSWFDRAWRQARVDFAHGY